LPHKILTLFAMAIIAGHNLFDGIPPGRFGSLAWLWTILHVPGNIEYMHGHSLFVLYPLIPWIAVMAAGYGVGPLFLQPVQIRQKRLAVMGIVALMLFLLLRISNAYGDPLPWVQRKDWMFTVFSIMNCQKYPPSLLYLLITLGFMFIGLAMFECTKLQRLGVLLPEFGQAPLLFYLVHILLIHGTAYVMAEYRGLSTDWLVSGSSKTPFPEIPAPEYGYSLMVVYEIWLFLIAVLYAICSAYNNSKIKQRI
jgi:uncharacterized membrane protein